ncbi:Cyclic AMP-dependent transcription factor ATF-6 alpha-like [Tropilaelaps mercedesae]|uniref:Cyclic AMP-dependent transcription factor ATF-6 alpha-like n=1 Tax=Tropilaelaps mercedesae TaxID=418985 RepID=A0A1V9XFD8_9ACAR|nr:Cyclic AMP-dependent transcription factor ATF-6 alpha-like [Tropilaelaps mercedesae]
MEHFIGQDDFLENNLLTPEDLRFDVDDEEPRSRCSAALGINCHHRCDSCEAQNGRFEHLGRAENNNDNDDKTFNKNNYKKNTNMSDEKVSSALSGQNFNNAVSWPDQALPISKPQRSGSTSVSKITNEILRSNSIMVSKKFTLVAEPKYQKRLLTRQQTGVGKGTYTRVATSVSDNNNLIQHHTASAYQGIALRLEINNDGTRGDLVEKLKTIDSNDIGGDVINSEHHDGSCSPDQIASSSSDSGLSGSEWAEAGENVEPNSTLAAPLAHSREDLPLQSELQDLLSNYTQDGANSDGTCQLPLIANHHEQQQQQQDSPQHQGQVHYHHQILQQVSLLQQPNSVLPNRQDQQQPKSESAGCPRTPPQFRPLFRMPPGTMSREEALARKRQRMIRNRESALQSRQRRKEETQLLQDEVGSLRNENMYLKDENAHLKRKVAELESRLRAGTSKGLMLCVFGVLIMINLGVGFPRSTSKSSVLKGHLTTSLENGVQPSQKIVVTGNNARQQIAVNSRHLLWINETRIQGLQLENDLTNGRPGCGGHWVNSTESLRVQEYLSRWASRAWVLASGVPPVSPLTDGLQASPFIRRSSSFWPDVLTSFDADSIRVIEEGSRAPSTGSPVASKEFPIPTPWLSRALLSEVRQRNDTFYLLAFSGPPDTVLLSARQANSTARPKIALLMPAIASASNDTIKIPPGRVAVMQIDCEVVSTKTLYLRRSLLPKNVQMAIGAVQHRTHPRKNARAKSSNPKNQRNMP